VGVSDIKAIFWSSNLMVSWNIGTYSWNFRLSSWKNVILVKKSPFLHLPPDLLESLSMHCKCAKYYNIFIHKMTANR